MENLPLCYEAHSYLLKPIITVFSLCRRDAAGRGCLPGSKALNSTPSTPQRNKQAKDCLYWTLIFMNCPLNVHCFPPQSTTEGTLKTLASIGSRGMEPWAPTFILKSPTPSVVVFVHRVLDELIKNLWSSGNKLRWVVHLLRRGRATGAKVTRRNHRL